MPIFESAQYKRGKSFNVSRFGVNLLGQIALDGKVSDSMSSSIHRNANEGPSRELQVRDLIGRRILKADGKGNLVLGEFGPGHCQWIFGKEGKPRKVADSIKAKVRKSGTRKPSSKTRSAGAIRPRTEEKQRAIKRAIRNNRRRFP